MAPMGPLASAVLLTFVALGAAPAERREVVVRPPRDAALPCPANAALRDALELLRSDVRLLAAGEALAPGALDASLSFRGGRWTLLLSQPDGTSVLSRDLDGQATDCVPVANLAAVVVDRYLTDVALPGQPVALQPLPPPPPFVRAISLTAGATVRPPFGASVAPGAEVTLAARMGSRGMAALSAWSALREDTATVTVDGRDRGLLAGRTWALHVSGGACLGKADAPSVCGGPQAGLFALAGEVRGTLYQKRAQQLFAPEVGLQGGLSWPLGAHFEAGLGVRAGVLLVRPALTVEGTDAVLRSAPLDLQAGLRFGWRHLF